MTHEGQSSAELETLVTLSLLAWGWNTRAARIAKALPIDTSPPDLLDEVANRLWVQADARSRELARARSAARGALTRAARLGYTVVARGGSAYPAPLAEIVDPPVVLWVRGDPGVLAERCVAVVGSRTASPTSLEIARQLTRDLAGAGVTTVSGLARGVDGAAHEGALDGGGRTVAVLGCGPDVIYPPEHEDLAARIEHSGVIISEFAPGTQPRPQHFPLRNRIISGLSSAVVVIEASEDSGSLITARSALEQGRDVLAVPGNPLSGRHRGGHSLIKDGARLVETVDDILEEVGWSRAPAQPAGGLAKSFAPDDLQSLMVPGEVHSVDDLAQRSGRSAPDLLAELSELEMAGRVTRAGTGGFLRLD